MIRVDIPGEGKLEIENLVLDYNGTLAVGGFLIAGLEKLICELACNIKIFVVTADTFGSVEKELEQLPVEIIKIGNGDERNEKLKVIRSLNPKATVSVGNGSNDEYMLQECIVGIGVIGQEGCSRKVLESADLVVNNIKSALELIAYPNRLKATLRF